MVRRIIQAILKWENMLRVGASASYVLWFHFSDTTS